MNNQTILKRHATDRYKQFWYPTRPLFTFLTGVFFAALGYIGVLPISWALWLAAIFGFDDLPLTPISNLITAMNNLANGRKKTKAIVMISSITLAIIVGAMLGFFVLSQSPLYLSLISSFIRETSCSAFMVSVGAILGTYLAHKIGKMSHYTGVGLGIFIVYWLPIHIPLMLELVYISAASFAFVTSIVAKQALRLYYKFRYGHSNADGYEMNKSPQDLEGHYQQQATKFGVTLDEFKNLITHCKAQIILKKESASLWDEFSGKRQPLTNAYKDIYHGLINSNSDIIEVKTLIKNSDEEKVGKILNQQNLNLMQTISFFGAALYPNLRLTSHQVSIYPGVSSNLVRPFNK